MKRDIFIVSLMFFTSSLIALVFLPSFEGFIFIFGNFCSFLFVMGFIMFLGRSRDGKGPKSELSRPGEDPDSKGGSLSPGHSFGDEVKNYANPENKNSKTQSEYHRMSGMQRSVGPEFRRPF